MWCSTNRLTLSKSLLAVILIAAMAFILSANGMPALAQGGLTLSTAFPGISAEPGQNLTFPIEIRNSTTGKVDLSVASSPEGWEASILGEGKIIHQVFTFPDRTAYADLNIQVPANAKPGNYEAVVNAKSVGSGSNLTLSINVTTEKAKSGELVAQYPQLQGPSDATFVFRLDLTNNTAREQSYSLGTQVPAGWEVSFSPAYDSKQIASLSLQAGKTQGLDVQVKPPREVKAGNYTIPVAAVSAGSAAKAELQVIITGKYSLTLATADERLNAQTTAGRETVLNLNVKNTGSADLKEIGLTSMEPADWSVTFVPAKIDTLAPGQTRQVVATIKPSSKAIAGDYAVSLSANTQETGSDTDIRVMVKTSTLWGFIGVLIVFLVIAGVAAAFHFYGRR